MSMVAVLVETDHDDPAVAVESVASGMRRAGYDVTEAAAGRLVVTPDGWTLSLVMEGHVDAREPEVGA